MDSSCQPHTREDDTESIPLHRESIKPIVTEH